jgi:antitoxin CcdA
LKQRANLTVDAKLLAEAKAMGINLSQALETGLRDELSRRWLAENRAAIESFNCYINERGTFAEQVLAAEAGLGVADLMAKRPGATSQNAAPHTKKRPRKIARRA